MPEKDRTVKMMGESNIQTAAGWFQLLFYSGGRNNREHMVFKRGELTGRSDVPTRVHSECFAGEVLGAGDCGCGEKLRAALRVIAGAGSGVLIYLRRGRRGSYLQCPDTGERAAHEPDAGELSAAAEIIKDMGVNSIRLLSDNPAELESLRRLGVEITGRTSLGRESDSEAAGWCGLYGSGGSEHEYVSEKPSAEQADDLLDSFENQVGPGNRPFVTLTYAQSLDGGVAARPGHPLILSCPETRALTHSLRARHEAILVGIGTVLADNPRLDVRLVKGNNPQPVVLDSRLRFPVYAKLLGRNGTPPMIITAENADFERQAVLERAGAKVFRLPLGPDGLIDLNELLKLLGGLGIKSVMVEGGAQVIGSFISSRLVDRIVITIAPMMVGGLRVVDNILRPIPSDFPRLRNITYLRVGRDLVLRAEPDWSEE